MTLIACAMTRDYVAMVGDRRLIDSTGAVRDDNRNKLVLCDGSVVFGYTGLARVGARYTDEWFCERSSRLFGLPLHERLNSLGHAVGSTIGSSMGIPKEYRRLAFLGVGFAHFDDRDGLQPFFCLLSNFHDHCWKPLSTPRDDFSFFFQRLNGEDSVAYESVGQLMSDAQTLEMQRRMRRLKETYRLSGRTMIPILAEAIRGVARKNLSVGRNLLAVAIPKGAVKPGSLLLTAGTGNDHHATFLFLPQDDCHGTHFSPLATAHGVQVAMRYGPARRDGSVHLP